MLKTALTIASLPANATRTALKSATNPKAINALSNAIAQGCLKIGSNDEEITIDGINVEVELNQERFLSTGGFASAVALGSLYWIGVQLKIDRRFAQMVKNLEDLQDALRSNNVRRSEEILSNIDLLSNPLIDPDNLIPLENADEIAPIYEAVFQKSATNGSMFEASKFTSSIDDSLKIGDRAAVLVARESTDEALQAMITKSKPIASKAVSRFVGGVLWVDTVWWVATSALDLGLNYLGIPEDQQRIPILADIPIIGGIFDLSDGVGSSFVDLIISPLFDLGFSLLGLEDEAEALFDALWVIISSAVLNPTLTPFVIALLDFYIDEVKIDFSVPFALSIQTFEGGTLDVFKIFRPEPIDILILWLYAIVGKIVFKRWMIPAFQALKR